jgi:hypothetical protein
MDDYIVYFTEWPNGAFPIVRRELVEGVKTPFGAFFQFFMRHPDIHPMFVNKAVKVNPQKPPRCYSVMKAPRKV